MSKHFSKIIPTSSLLQALKEVLLIALLYGMEQRHGQLRVTASQGHAAHKQQTWASIQADWPPIPSVAPSAESNLWRAIFKRLTMKQSHHTLQNSLHTLLHYYYSFTTLLWLLPKEGRLSERLQGLFKGMSKSHWSGIIKLWTLSIASRGQWKSFPSNRFLAPHLKVSLRRRDDLILLWTFG